MEARTLINAKMMLPRSLLTVIPETPGGCMLPLSAFIGTESAVDGAGQITLSFDIEQLRNAGATGDLTVPVSLTLCGPDARTLGKALIEAADAAERVAEESRHRR